MQSYRFGPAVLLLFGVVGCGEPTLPEIGEVGEFNDGNLSDVLGRIIAADSPDTVPALGAVTVRLVSMEGKFSSVIDVAVAGVRAVGSSAVQPEDQWHLGSITKSMTASLAGRLVDRGLLSWDTTIAGVFPELVGGIDSVYEDVRLDELLYHTSGLPTDLTQTPSWQDLRTSTLPLIEQRRAWIEEILNLPHRERGDHLYSNAGYVVAGAMLERITGVAWEELLRTEIFNAFGMTSAGFGAPGVAGIPNQPRGHQYIGPGWQPVEPGPNADNPAAMGPAGTVHASLTDLARYLIEHLNGLRDSSDFFEPATWSKLHTPFPGTGYALGWGVDERTWANGTVLAHSGSNTMWFAVVWIAPERNLVMAAVTNAGGPDPDSGGGDIAERVTDRAIRAMILRAGFSL